MEVLAKYNYLISKKSIMNKIYFSLFVIIFYINYSSCLDCPRDKPILKNKECISIFCQPHEFENQICTISNPFIKSQWLNNIHSFDNDAISHVYATSNKNGELFLIAQGYTAGTSGDKYIYAFHQDGNGLFYNKVNNTNRYYSFETIDLPDNKYPEIFYTVNIENNQYLLSTQVYNETFLIDYKNKNYTIFTSNIMSFSSDTLFVLKGYDDDENEKEYFTDYINCKDYLSHNVCYLGLRIFHLNLKKITILSEKNDEILVNTKAKLNCFQNDNLYIQCIYTELKKNEEGPEKYNRVISLFNNKNLNMEFTEILQENMNIENTFESSIQLNGNIFVTGFSLPNNRNIIKLLLKKFVINDKEIKLEDYLPDINSININEDNQYLIERSLAKRNCMIKISENKFAILLNEFSGAYLSSSFNKNILLLIFNIFDKSKISIRYYKINFELYNLLIYEDLRGYTLNNFLGILLEAGYNSDSFKPKAIFLTFGYANSTYDENFIDKNLKENNTNSVINIRNYTSEIENNLFSYKNIGVKIISLPERQISGYFINNKTNEEIKVGDILSFDTVLRFILVRDILKGDAGDIFSIDFAVIAQEPDFDLMNKNAERVEIFPINDTNLEKSFYSPQNLTGRVIKYKFDLDCYDSCEGCSNLSNNPEDQQCIK